MVVKLKNIYKNNSLKLGKNYDIIGIEADDYRILNDNNEPVLYSKDLFIVTDIDEPDDWISKFGNEGERYAYPQELMRVGFFEDYFDGDKRAKEIFESYMTTKKIFLGDKR